MWAWSKDSLAECTQGSADSSPFLRDLDYPHFRDEEPEARGHIARLVRTETPNKACRHRLTALLSSWLLILICVSPTVGPPKTGSWHPSPHTHWDPEPSPDETHLSPEAPTCPGAAHSTSAQTSPSPSTDLGLKATAVSSAQGAIQRLKGKDPCPRPEALQQLLLPPGQAQSPHHGLQALQDLARSTTCQTHKCAPTLGPLTLLTSPLEFCFPALPILVPRPRLKGHLPCFITLHFLPQFHSLQDNLWNSVAVTVVYFPFPV